MSAAWTRYEGFRHRRLLAALVMAGVNLPWMALWWLLSARTGETRNHVPELYILLVVGCAGMVILPCLLVPSLARRRWLLIAMLAFVNLYWAIKWIERYHAFGPHDLRYLQARPRLLGLMGLSSVAAAMLYAAAAALLNRVRGRSPELP